MFIHERFGQFMYGLYPHDQRWRVNLALIIGLLSIVPMFLKTIPHRGRYIAVWAVVYPVVVWWLMYGVFRAGARRNPAVGWINTDANYRIRGDCRRASMGHFTGAGTSFQYASRAGFIRHFH